jgi:hypothetical protein
MIEGRTISGEDERTLTVAVTGVYSDSQVPRVHE